MKGREYIHHVKKFEDFTPRWPLYEMGDAVPVNEAFLDRFFALFTKVFTMFKDSTIVKQSLEKTIIEEGESTSKFLPKNVKVGETYLLNMGDGENPDGDFSIAFTKIANLPDGSHLFQISGTTSNEMLKALVGTEKVEDLVKNNVMAILSSTGFVKDKAPTMRLVKNILPNGKDYTTKALFQGAVPISAVEKTINTL